MQLWIGGVYIIRHGSKVVHQLSRDTLVMRREHALDYLPTITDHLFVDQSPFIYANDTLWEVQPQSIVPVFGHIMENGECWLIIVDPSREKHYYKHFLEQNLIQASKLSALRPLRISSIRSIEIPSSRIMALTALKPSLKYAIGTFPPYICIFNRSLYDPNFGMFRIAGFGTYDPFSLILKEVD